MNSSGESKSDSETNSVAKSPKRYPWKKGFVIFLILLICIAYPLLKMRWAKNKVESFCSRISIGMTVQGLEQRAKDYGLKVRISNGSDSQNPKILVWEGWVFARWFCVIEHSNGKVVNKEAFSLD
ncbi:hypothetical protein ACFL1N_14760 [Thermodesulfobacteriota bacterium]